MNLKPHHRALLRELPLHSLIPYHLERQKGFADLKRAGLVDYRVNKTGWRTVYRHKLTNAAGS